MSESNPQQENTAATGVKLDGLFVTKLGMSSVYNENGELVPVTVMKFESWVVSNVKTKERDGYEAVQLAARPRKAKNSNKAEVKRLKAAGFENGAQLVREVRQGLPEGVTVGQRVALESLAKGDFVKVTSRSKGHGYAGVMKRWNFAGGPAAHGSKFHRKPGSIGNRTWPGRVMPGRRMAGHYGNETVTVPRVAVVDVIPEENVVLLKGPVPGGPNTLVKLMKV